MIPKSIQTWQMTEPGKLLRTEIPTPELQAGEVLVPAAIIATALRVPPFPGRYVKVLCQFQPVRQ